MCKKFKRCRKEQSTRHLRPQRFPGALEADLLKNAAAISFIDHICIIFTSIVLFTYVHTYIGYTHSLIHVTLLISC